jgi:hypothetical protein
VVNLGNGNGFSVREVLAVAGGELREGPACSGMGPAVRGPRENHRDRVAVAPRPFPVGGFERVWPMVSTSGAFGRGCWEAIL